MAYLCTAEGLRLQIRQVERWLRAARQDLEPGIKFLHASYGMGVLDMLRQLAGDDEVRAATGADPRALSAELGRLQDAAQAAIAARLG